MHAVSVQVTVEPPVQVPAPLHVVPYVHRFPLSHAPPTLIGAVAHVASPSHE